VPYKGSAPGFNDLMGGQVQFGFDAVPIGLQHVKAGRVRAVATTAPKRLTFLPDIAAANETLKGFEVVNWYGLMAPAGDAARIIERLHTESIKVMSPPDVQARLRTMGGEPEARTLEQTAAFLRSEYARWGKVVREAGIKAE